MTSGLTDSFPRTLPKKLVKEAVRDKSRISGLTHTFYRYPARFSPSFAKACIASCSKPGDLILDPYMGGGTTIVEAMIAGRRAIGSDINELAAFVATVKTTPMTSSETNDLVRWSELVVPALRATDISSLENFWPKNMAQPQARWLKKTIGGLLESIESELATQNAKEFARCVVLNAGQWALNGKRDPVTSSAFRNRVTLTAEQMLGGMESLSLVISDEKRKIFAPLIRTNDAAHIDRDHAVLGAGLVNLVVTSPPYPGIHMLYHRWQVDGRRETDVPYWIANRKDGAGASHYNFADRKRPAEHNYYIKAAEAYAAIRKVMAPNALMVQMVAFSEPQRQLPLFLRVLSDAGFEEMREANEKRIWRDVPGRRWHASTKGKTSSSREVVLFHRAS